MKTKPKFIHKVHVNIPVSFQKCANRAAQFPAHPSVVQCQYKIPANQSAARFRLTPVVHRNVRQRWAFFCKSSCILRSGNSISLQRCKSRELRGGNLLTNCDCVKRNGLQTDCPRSECRGRPLCITKPIPICCPSKYMWRYANVTMGKSAYPTSNKSGCPSSKANDCNSCTMDSSDIVCCYEGWCKLCTFWPHCCSFIDSFELGSREVKKDGMGEKKTILTLNDTCNAKNHDQQPTMK